jgi:hypothetical protein
MGATKGVLLMKAEMPATMENMRILETLCTKKAERYHFGEGAERDDDGRKRQRQRQRAKRNQPPK